MELRELLAALEEESLGVELVKILPTAVEDGVVDILDFISFNSLLPASSINRVSGSV